MHLLKLFPTYYDEEICSKVYVNSEWFAFSGVLIIFTNFVN